MIVIRRLVDRHRAYTGIFLPGEAPQIFPTSDQEHGRILAVYKQERAHEGIINDFSEFAVGKTSLPPNPVRAAPEMRDPWPAPEIKNSAAASVLPQSAAPAPAWLTTTSPGGPAVRERDVHKHDAPQ